MEAMAALSVGGEAGKRGAWRRGKDQRAGRVAERVHINTHGVTAAFVAANGVIGIVLRQHLEKGALRLAVLRLFICSRVQRLLGSGGAGERKKEEKRKKRKKVSNKGKSCTAPRKRETLCTRQDATNCITAATYQLIALAGAEEGALRAHDGVDLVQQHAAAGGERRPCSLLTAVWD